MQFGVGEGWGIGVMKFQSMGKMGKNFCPHFLQPLLENVDRRSCNSLIPIYYNSHRKSGPSPPVVARTLEYLVGLPSKAATCGIEKKISSDQNPRDP